ncbi:FHA domain-containing protein [Streptomyces sp. NPDC001340]
MTSTVTLTVVSGPLRGARYVIDQRTTRVLRRSADWDPQLPDDDRHRTVSRHHCMLDVNPPDVRVRDFGSLNGTFVNGTMIGRRRTGQTPQEVAVGRFPEHDLYDGDELRLGDTTFRVDVRMPTRTRLLVRCRMCGRDADTGINGHDGDHMCASCRSAPE